MANETVRVAIYQCPTHETLCVSLGYNRVTSSKCCGQWKRLRQWRVAEYDLVLALAAGKETP